MSSELFAALEKCSYLVFSYFSYRLLSLHLHPRVSRETPQQIHELTTLQAMPHEEGEQDDSEGEYGENEPVPDLEKDDMMARRTRSFQRASFNQFLPVPGSVKYNICPVSAMPQLRSQPKLNKSPDRDRYSSCSSEDGGGVLGAANKRQLHKD